MKKTMIAVVATVALMLTGCASADMPKTKAASDGPKPTNSVEKSGKLAPKSLVPSPDKPLKISEMTQDPVDENGISRHDLLVPDHWKDFVSITDILGEKEAQKLVDDAVDNARIQLLVMYDNGDLFPVDKFPANMVMVPKSENISANEIKERLIPAWKEYLERKEISAEMRTNMPRTASLAEHMKYVKTIWKPEGALLAAINDVESGKVPDPFLEIKNSNTNKNQTVDDSTLNFYIQISEMFPILNENYGSLRACGFGPENANIPPNCKFGGTVLLVNKPTVLYSSHPAYPDGVTVGSLVVNIWEKTDGEIVEMSEDTRPMTLTPKGVDNGKTQWVTTYLKDYTLDKSVEVREGFPLLLFDGFY